MAHPTLPPMNVKWRALRPLEMALKDLEQLWQRRSRLLPRTLRRTPRSPRTGRWNRAVPLSRTRAYIVYEPSPKSSSPSLQESVNDVTFRDVKGCPECNDVRVHFDSCDPRTGQTAVTVCRTYPHRAVPTVSYGYSQVAPGNATGCGASAAALLPIAVAGRFRSSPFAGC